MGSIDVAEIIIVNTCTVTSIADKKTRQMVRKACASNTKQNCKILITGCASAIDSSTYLKIDNRIKIVSKENFQTELSLICDNQIVDIKKTASILASDNFRSRAAIKIQDGCDNACTYCIVHTARGPAKSMPHNDIENKISAMLDVGIKEIVLSGVDLGAYNDAGYTLHDLCKNLLKIIGDKNARIRISSIEPNNVSDELIDLIAISNGKICRHLHIPLQSGSDKVLREMDRHYSSEQYLKLVKKLRKAMPQIALSTDVIVGFPGEEEVEFKQTYDFCEKCGFMKIHVFPYSMRKGTPAALRTDQIDEEIKSRRAYKLRKLSDELAKYDMENRKGTDELVLVEGDGKARTESYHLINSENFTCPGDLIDYQL